MNLEARIAVEVARRAAMRVLPIFEAAHPGDTRPRAALDLVRRWLSGEDVAAELYFAAYASANAARDADADEAFFAASSAAHAAAAASSASAASAHAAVTSAADAASERAQQRADILALTAGA